MSLMDATVEFQTDLNSFSEGIVIAHDNSTGSLVIRDAEGIHWRGIEDHIEVIDLPSERAGHAG
ncbi:hypothetical protein [Cupriavidus lacunae]|uniref:Uncharacterized protein n=1 Tax=Cupriavidus lacunae TaxID=2666307 RepID=A0A370NKG7_9BURK|nr:hypothetical protein [Cupriavidus lacunae]RDK06104.1 hypothetical protein DN412_33355 [Cupriavidus lacunae]